MTLMERRRALMGQKSGSSPILPAEYQQVEWIGNNTVGPKIGMTLSVTIPYNVYLVVKPTNIGSGSTVSQACMGRRAYSNTTNDWYVFFPSTTTINKYGDNFTMESSFANDIFTVNGIVNVPSNPGVITLFRPVSRGNWMGQIYRFSVTKDDNTIIDLVPCYRKADSVIGMFDLISETFKTTETGTFIKGADV